MKKALSLLLVLCVIVSALAVPAWAASSDKVYAKNTNITSPFNGFNSVTVKAGVKVAIGKGGGLEVRKSLTVESGGSIVGTGTSSVLLFRSGSTSSGITLYYNVKGEIKELPDGVQRLWEKGYATDVPANFRWQSGKWVLEGESQVDNFGNQTEVPPGFPPYGTFCVDYDQHNGGGVAVNGVPVNSNEPMNMTGAAIRFVLEQPGDRREDVPLVELDIPGRQSLVSYGDAPTLKLQNGAFDYTPTGDAPFVVRVWWSEYDKLGLEHPSAAHVGDREESRPPQEQQPEQHKDNLQMAWDAAEKLNRLGLFQGVGTNPDGTNNYDLERKPRRVEALVMLIRLLGQESAAVNGSWSHPFTDVPAWADKYVGYAYETGLTNGVSADKFGSDDTASGAQYLTFVLRAMGYSDKNGEDFTWDNPHELAMKSGFLTGDADVQTLWRGDMAILSFNALHSVCKDGRALKDKLISDGVFTGEQYALVTGHPQPPEE